VALVIVSLIILLTITYIALPGATHHPDAEIKRA